ncbi:hypothetical protein KQX54_016068 [Cotesia glomerata]|uniref:Secreted protein n=1 Tax=Cotesia glomerata TaxID=32391 RepID=A0AAV7HYE2_COTGL|nr:hypothetical protein KQX54_016068 [Cotesia glomerata]
MGAKRRPWIAPLLCKYFAGFFTWLRVLGQAQATQDTQEHQDTRVWNSASQLEIQVPGWFDSASQPTRKRDTCFDSILKTLKRVSRVDGGKQPRHSGSLHASRRPYVFKVFVHWRSLNLAIVLPAPKRSRFCIGHDGLWRFTTRQSGYIKSCCRMKKELEEDTMTRNEQGCDSMP